MTEKKEKTEEKGEQWIENEDKMRKLSKSVAEASKELCCRILRYEKSKGIYWVFFLLSPNEKKYIQYYHRITQSRYNYKFNSSDN